MLSVTYRILYTAYHILYTAYMHKKLKNGVGLITYPDSLGRTLEDLNTVLTQYFPKTFTHVHILPFYPSSADRGFAPLTYKKVDPVFGDWDDIRAIGEKHEIMADLMLNHISARSTYFQDYMTHGERSVFHDFFITPKKFSHHLERVYRDDTTREDLTGHVRLVERFPKSFRSPTEKYAIAPLEWIAWKIRRLDPIFHSKGISRLALRKIYRPRPGSPFVPFIFGDKRLRRIWCTFSKEQIDLDIHNPGVQEIFKSSMRHLAEQGVDSIRMDAAGYIVKKRGTTNFLIPETYEYISRFAEMAHDFGLSVLPEVHAQVDKQKQLAKTPGVDYVYDFALPMLVLQAIFDANGKNLKHWIRIRPKNTVTTLDTHDGIPVPDVKGLMTEEESNRTVARIHEHGGNDALRASGLNSDNVDIYQVNCTYYSAIGANDDAYILARALQFFIPGMAQVYYVGLLAGENDHDLLEQTGVGRDINRHPYSIKEIAREAEKPVVKRLLKLIKLRNTHPAFEGSFTLERSPQSKLMMTWTNGADSLTLDADLKSKKVHITFSKNGRKEKVAQF